jgi:hypothetical protein
LIRVQKDSTSTAQQLADAQRALNDARKEYGRVSAETARVTQSPFLQMVGAMDLGIKNTGAFMSNLNRLSSKGYGALAMQLLEMGGPEAERIAASSVGWTAAALSAANRRAGVMETQSKQMEMLPGMLKVRKALQSGKSYNSLIDSGDFDVAELNAILRTMQGELNKTAAGRALIATMNGELATELRNALRGYPTFLEGAWPESPSTNPPPPGNSPSPGDNPWGYPMPPGWNDQPIGINPPPPGWDRPIGINPPPPGWDKPVHLYTSQPARSQALQITVKGEGVLSGMIEATVDGRLVAVSQTVSHGNVAG